jgi:hypothetical protein
MTFLAPTGFPLQGDGHGRTAVKLRLNWQKRPITGLRVLYDPSGPKPSVRNVAITVLGLARAFTMNYPALPRVQIEAAATARSSE